MIRKLVGWTGAGVAVLVLGHALASDQGDVEFSEQGSATYETELDLTAVWDRQDLSPIELTYSADGWGKDASASGRTVDLKLAKAEGGTATSLATGLTGKGIYVWRPAALQRTVYRIEHVVSSAVVGMDDPVVAYFSFENCDMELSPEEVRAAVVGESQACVVTNDKDHPWSAVGGAGDGLVAPEGASSALVAEVSGRGTLSFAWRLAGNSAVVQVDGQSVRSLASADSWQTASVMTVGYGDHVIRFVSADGGLAVKNLQWITEDAIYRETLSAQVRVDLRQGVRVMKDRSELLPFTYSSTNFVGITGSPSETIARVSVVRLTGEGDDVSQWTEEVPKTYRELKREQGEGVVVWSGKAGVWKATFDIIAEGGESVHTEVAVFDMRKCIRGFCILLK